MPACVSGLFRCLQPSGKKLDQGAIDEIGHYYGTEYQHGHWIRYLRSIRLGYEFSQVSYP